MSDYRDITRDMLDDLEGLIEKAEEAKKFFRAEIKYLQEDMIAASDEDDMEGFHQLKLTKQRASHCHGEMFDVWMKLRAAATVLKGLSGEAIHDDQG